MASKTSRTSETARPNDGVALAQAMLAVAADLKNQKGDRTAAVRFNDIVRKADLSDETHAVLIDGADKVAAQHEQSGNTFMANTFRGMRNILAAKRPGTGNGTDHDKEVAAAVARAASHPPMG